jgi:hypothetical protein
MLSVQRFAGVLALLALAVVVVGCETATGRPTAQYADDQKITADVKSRLVADQASNLTRVGVTTTNGVVNLTGAVDSPDRAARAALLASQVPGVRSVVNNIQVAAAPPVTATPSVTTSRDYQQANVTPGQPPIDAAGTVAQFDPQTGLLTFQDGRMARVTSETTVWGPANLSAIRPGAQVLVQHAQPVGFHPASTAPAGVSTWRMGTVNHVDRTTGLIFLNDGTVVRVGPSTVIQSGDRRVGLAQIQPGSQIAIGMPASSGTTATPAPPPTAVPSTAAPVYGSALPREAAPVDTPQVQIFVVPQPR